MGSRVDSPHHGVDRWRFGWTFLPADQHELNGPRIKAQDFVETAVLHFANGLRIGEREMNLRTIFRFQFGDREAIEAVARSKSAFVVGIWLVLITTIPRNYDQTHISEDPWRWLFGSLFFSLISGTWMYLVAYLFGGWRGRWNNQSEIGDGESGWLSFMGMFWMTAPVAWIYAIPVERWLDPVEAAKANVALLASVSVWRVLLLTRCVAVVCRSQFSKVFAWVMVAASVEVLVVGIFGGLFARQIMAGMGGMRNSPAEDVLVHAMGAAMGNSLWIFPVALLIGFFWGWRGTASRLPARSPDSIPFLGLLVLTITWILIALTPQRELAVVAEYERRLEAGRTREALDLLSQITPDQLPASRVLQPKPFEWDVFRKLPPVIGELRETDARWVREYFVGHLATAVSHYRSRWGSVADWDTFDRGHRYMELKNGWERFGPDATGVLKVLRGLKRIPEGPDWLVENSLLLEVWIGTAKSGETMRSHEDNREEQRAGWKAVLELMGEKGTNAPPTEIER